MPENIKHLVFYSGDRGMGRDTFMIQGTLIFLAREDRGTEVVRWVYLQTNAAGAETSHPVAAEATLQVLSLKEKDPETVIFTEDTFNQGLAIKKYPFSWEAAQ